MSVAVRVSQRDLAGRCPYCHDPLEGARAVVCGACAAVAHPGCALELARCAASRPLGALRLLARGPRRGLLLRRETRELHLLGPARAEPWLPGTYRVAVRAPAEALRDVTSVSAVLARPRGVVVASLDVRVTR